ncbi:chaperone protein DnaJ-like [Leptopilina heterotoma]|uniref:chaperone protein DnaJ-like n=1 Tax=Leptopilina heterotoma TaxID=63436 RepID=UPI001CA81728|nr:chaperone protein DnaJ-like [Leptopilina heterotoma]
MNIPNLKANKTPIILIRGLATISKTTKNHYDTLQVKTNATQEEIKSSYYELSKQYHPDVNKEANAKEKFRDITEAYEILGNYKIRRQYDRGMAARGIHVFKHAGRSSSAASTSSSSATMDVDDDDDDRDIEHMAFYKSRMRNYPKPIYSSNNNKKIFDFDLWTRAHYGDSLKRTVDENQQRVDRNEKVITKKSQYFKKANDISVIFGMTFIIVCVCALSISQRNYDDPLETNSEDDQ